jgi:ubiquitin-protein ligase
VNALQCPNGHENNTASTFCTSCGQRLVALPDRRVVAEPAPPVPMSPRARRLTSDYAALTEAFAGHPAITVLPIGPTPPERYRVVYDVPALALTPDRRPHRTHQTIVEILLPPTYPREKPYLTTNYAVFHPNFGAHVCIADHWSPSQSLVDIIVEVGDMLQWRLYNVKSPLNAVAASWSDENVSQLPVGNVDVLPLRDDSVVLGEMTVTAPEENELGDRA